MESDSDLFNLPIAFECHGDRNFNFAREDWCTPVDLWRMQTYRKTIDEHHYDNISRIEWQIYDLDARMRVIAKGANADIRIRLLEAQKRPLLRQRTKLRAGWSKIAIRMSEDSRKLLILPREIREKIYSYLYTKSTAMKPLILNFPDIDVRHSLLPRDPFHYLNAGIVDPEIAAEAAQTLYDTNTFNVVSYSQTTLDQFLRTDHFGSKVVPKDVIRRLHMNVTVSYIQFHLSHEQFEDSNLESTTAYLRERDRISSLLDMTELRVLNLNIDAGTGAVELRAISPIIKTLKGRGVSVNVRAPDHDSSFNESSFGVLNWFDEPTVRELELVEKEGGLDFTRYQWEYNDFESMFFVKDSPKQIGSDAQWRVYLQEHYERFRAKAVDKHDKA